MLTSAPFVRQRRSPASDDYARATRASWRLIATRRRGLSHTSPSSCKEAAANERGCGTRSAPDRGAGTPRTCTWCTYRRHPTGRDVEVEHRRRQRIAHHQATVTRVDRTAVDERGTRPAISPLPERSSWAKPASSGRRWDVEPVHHLGPRLIPLRPGSWWMHCSIGGTTRWFERVDLEALGAERGVAEHPEHLQIGRSPRRIVPVTVVNRLPVLITSVSIPHRPRSCPGARKCPVTVIGSGRPDTFAAEVARGGRAHVPPVGVATDVPPRDDLPRSRRRRWAWPR